MTDFRSPEEMEAYIHGLFDAFIIRSVPYLLTEIEAANGFENDILQGREEQTSAELASYLRDIPNDLVNALNHEVFYTDMLAWATDFPGSTGDEMGGEMEFFDQELFGKHSNTRQLLEVSNEGNCGGRFGIMNARITLFFLRSHLGLSVINELRRAFPRAFVRAYTVAGFDIPDFKQAQVFVPDREIHEALDDVENQRHREVQWREEFAAEDTSDRKVTMLPSTLHRHENTQRLRKEELQSSGLKEKIERLCGNDPYRLFDMIFALENGDIPVFARNPDLCGK